MKIKRIISLLNHHFPSKKAEGWDSVGLQIGNPNKDVSSVIIALDLNTEVLEQAINTQSYAIIVHHPFLFPDQSTLNWQGQFAKYPYKKLIYQRAIALDICVLVLHTNFDIQTEGMSAGLAEILDIKIIKQNFLQYGFLFEGIFNQENISQLLIQKLKCKYLGTNIKNPKIYHRIAFLPGSGSIEDILDASNNKVDLIITSDIKWSTWVLLDELKIDAIQVSHSVENVFVNQISKLLKEKFKKDLKINTYYIDELGGNTWY